MNRVFESRLLYTTQYKMVKEWFLLQNVSEYDQEIPQSQTADQPTALCGRVTDMHSNKTSERQQELSNQLSLSLSVSVSLSLSLCLVKMIAKLDRIQSNAYKNKDQHRTPHKQWEVHKTIEQQQQNHRKIALDFCKVFAGKILT